MSHVQRALCNDCLAENALPRGSDGVMACVCCGGEACDCWSCMDVLMALHAGERDPAKLQLINLEPGFAWTPEKGIAA